MKKTFLSKSDDFYRTLWTLVFPVTLQSLVNYAVNSADVFMLGYVGQNALSAVSLANQVQFWVTGFFWGATGGTALMIAQYWGKGDSRAVQAVMGIGLKVSLAFTSLLSLTAIFFSVAVMRLFTDDAELIAIGAAYLKVIGVTYVFQSVSQIYECGMRSVGRAGASTVISSAALGTNVLLNATFIFGLAGAPKLGVTGVAVATLIARTLEVAFCVADALTSRVIQYDVKIMFGRHAQLTKDFFHYSIPALLNDVSWTVAFSTYSMILGHLEADVTDVLSAAAVASTIRNLCTVVCMSLGQAAVAIIGQELGAGKLDAARRDGRRITILSVVLGAITGLVMLLLRPLLLNVFPLTDTARDYLRFMLLISSYYVIGQSLNTAIITGVFRAGGDTKFGMWCDTVNMWCVAVPIGFFSAFVLRLPAKPLYVILCLDEFYKIPVEYLHYKKYRWLKVVTRA